MFIAFEYIFTDKERKICINLLFKYHPFVKCTVIVDDKSDKLYEGQITLDWLHKLPNGKIYKLKTKTHWSEYSTIKTLPKFKIAKQSKTNHGNNIDTNITKCIDDVISKRMELKGAEVFVSETYNAKSFEDVLKAFWMCKHLKHVTRYYISRRKECIILVLSELYPIKILKSGCGDSALGIFDFANGFSNYAQAKVLPEWQEDFKVWSKNCFNETHWDQPIIKERK